MDDNARPQQAHIVNNWFGEGGSTKRMRFHKNCSIFFLAVNRDHAHYNFLFFVTITGITTLL